MWIRRNPFRAYLHPTKKVDAIVRSNGLEPRFYRKTLLWQVVVYARNGASNRPILTPASHEVQR